MSYHEMTQDEEVKEMLLKLLRYLGRTDSLASSLHGFSYGYFISGDMAFIDWIDKGLDVLKTKQKSSGDSLHDGLVYDKVIYHRANSYIYPIGYGLAAIDASKGSKRS